MKKWSIFLLVCISVHYKHLSTQPCSNLCRMHQCVWFIQKKVQTTNVMEKYFINLLDKYNDITPAMINLHAHSVWILYFCENSVRSSFPTRLWYCLENGVICQLNNWLFWLVLGQQCCQTQGYKRESEIIIPLLQDFKLLKVLVIL